VVRAWTEKGTSPSTAVQSAALRQHLAAAVLAIKSDPATGAGRRLGRDMALVRRDGLGLTAIFRYYGLQSRPARHDGWVLAEMDRLGKATQIRTRTASWQFGRRRKKSQQPSIFTAAAAGIFYGAACMSIRNGHAPAITSEGSPARRPSKAKSSKPPIQPCGQNRPANVSLPSRVRWIKDRRQGYVHHRSPDEVAEQLREVAVNLKRRSPHAVVQYGT